MTKRSALRLIKTVWDNQKCESWDGVNHSMADAVVLAIGAMLKFSPKDFEIITGTMRSGYWSNWEYWYALAISIGNRSYIEAFEKFNERKPFFANQVLPVASRGFTHMTGRRARERLAVGSEVEGYGEVTSMTNERVVITMRGEARKIHQFTHDDLRRLFPASKKATREAPCQETKGETP